MENCEKHMTASGWKNSNANPTRREFDVGIGGVLLAIWCPLYKPHPTLTGRDSAAASDPAASWVVG